MNFEQAPCFDWQGVRERLEDDHQLIQDLILLFVEDFEHQYMTLEKYVRQADWDMVETTAHGMKGAAANVGAIQIAEATKTLELMARSGETHAMPQQLPLLQTLFKTFQQHLGVAIETNSGCS